MKIYLDNCCFNRPYDDQEQMKVRLETEAKLEIQKLIKAKEVSLAWSFMLDFENEQNMDGDQKKEIFGWQEYADVYFLATNQTEKIARKFQNIGISEKDAVHIACAIETDCQLFITTDKGILKKKTMITDIKIINPIDFFETEEI